MSIPKVLHNIWVGPLEFPSEYSANLQIFKSLHPDWEVKEWREDSLLANTNFHPAVYEKLRIPAERADILRLELLMMYGGVYLDSDIKIVRNLDTLLQLGEFIVCELKPGGRINNAFIASIADHPILKLAMENIKPTKVFGLDKLGTGPLLLNEMIKQYPHVKLPAQTFHSTEPHSLIRYGIDSAATTWKTEQDLKNDIKKLKLTIDNLQNENLRLKMKKSKKASRNYFIKLQRRLRKSIKHWKKTFKRNIRLKYSVHLLNQHGHKVIMGPFKGMLLPKDFRASASTLAPKIIGIYESKVVKSITDFLNLELKSNKIRAVVLGSAEGWYATGIGRISNVVSVDTFEEQTLIRPKEEELFVLNGVAHKLIQHGRFENPIQLIETAGWISDDKRILLCDIEGHEKKFLSPVSSSILARFSLVIIEIHDHVVPSIGKNLINLLELTHDISIISQENSQPSKYGLKVPSIRNFLQSEERNEKKLNYWIVGRLLTSEFAIENAKD